MGIPANEVHLCGDGSGGHSCLGFGRQLWHAITGPLSRALQRHPAPSLPSGCSPNRCRAAACELTLRCGLAPPAAVPLVRRICEEMGEVFELNEYDRFTKLTVGCTVQDSCCLPFV